MTNDVQKPDWQRIGKDLGLHFGVYALVLGVLTLLIVLRG